MESTLFRLDLFNENSYFGIKIFSYVGSLASFLNFGLKEIS
jgi:hypothetical protein